MEDEGDFDNIDIDLEARNFSDFDFHPFVTPDNISSIDFDPKIISLVKSIERDKPKIYENEKLASNVKKETLNSINLDKLYIKSEVKNKKGRPPQYTSKEIKDIAKKIGISAGTKTKDELISEIRKMLPGYEDED